MAENILNVKIKQRYDTEANWKSSDPVLLAGECAYSSDKGNVYKQGNGTSKWSALSYNTADKANQLTTNAGSATQPVYFSNGKPAACTYTLGKSVPSDAKFTDTVYTLPTASATLGGVKTTSTVTSASGLTACPIISGVPYYKNTTYTALKNPYSFHLNGVSYDGSAVKYMNLLPLVIGTQTAATGSWTGTASTVSALEDGLTIRYWLPYAGSGNATLNLTLSDGTATGAINCYYSGTTRLTTHYAAGNIITLTYRSGVSIAGSTAAYTGWWADANYDSGNTKNTAGSTNTSSKIFLIGAASQAANPQTYSHDTAYVGTDGCLYSNNTKVSVEGHTHSYLPLAGGTLTGDVTAPTFVGALSGNAATASSAVKATQDSAGQQINTTYIKGLSVSGKVITYTKGDGTTGTITTQDTDTTYTSLKNPYAITIQGNGTTLTNGTYDGSSAKTVNITPSAIGAAASSHTHNYAGSSSAGGAATSAAAVYGTLTNPSSGTTYYIPFHSGVSSGNKSLLNNDGLLYYTCQGTTSAVGTAQLGLGNATASGTAGNKRGMIYMYGSSSGFTTIVPGNNTTSNITLTLPSGTGTIALTSGTVANATTWNGYKVSKVSALPSSPDSTTIYLVTG